MFLHSTRLYKLKHCSDLIFIISHFMSGVRLAFGFLELSFFRKHFMTMNLGSNKTFILTV